jgi:hypothetical protein
MLAAVITWVIDRERPKTANEFAKSLHSERTAVHLVCSDVVLCAVRGDAEGERRRPKGLGRPPRSGLAVLAAAKPAVSEQTRRP